MQVDTTLYWHWFMKNTSFLNMKYESMKYGRRKQPQHTFKAFMFFLLIFLLWQNLKTEWIISNIDDVYK